VPAEWPGLSVSEALAKHERVVLQAGGFAFGSTPATLPLPTLPSGARTVRFWLQDNPCLVRE